MLLQATHLYKCTLLIGPKPRKRSQCWAQYWTGWRHRRRQIKALLAEYASSKEGELILWNWQNVTNHQGALHLHSSHNHTLSLLWEWFWWLDMDNQMHQSIKCCMYCLQLEGKLSKAPLHPIVATAPMDLLCVDITSIEMTLKLNRPPKVASILVFQDHFTKHVMAYVTPNQTLKTVAKFLYQGYISIFRALARILSDWGANFISSIIDKMCKLLSMSKLQTMLYYPQMNGLVERSHQTIRWMIRKLGEDKKMNWPGHLAEIVHT